MSHTVKVSSSWVWEAAFSAGFFKLLFWYLFTFEIPLLLCLALLCYGLCSHHLFVSPGLPNLVIRGLVWLPLSCLCHVSHLFPQLSPLIFPFAYLVSVFSAPCRILALASSCCVSSCPRPSEFSIFFSCLSTSPVFVPQFKPIKPKFKFGTFVRLPQHLHGKRCEIWTAMQGLTICYHLWTWFDSNCSC